MANEERMRQWNVGRGLTLVEVLASAVLLAVLAAVVMPWLTRAAAVAPSDDGDTNRLNVFLERAADALLERDPDFVMTVPDEGRTIDLGSLALDSVFVDDVDEPLTLRVVRLAEREGHERSDTEDDHADVWLLFELLNPGAASSRHDDKRIMTLRRVRLHDNEDDAAGGSGKDRP